jgi:methanol---5-hydroxybenzimidazolylcobamide Co-methyltransferase
MEAYNHLAIEHPDDLIFGHSPRPLKLANGLVIGGGIVYPELNFTLPAMRIAADTIPEIHEQYSQIIENACARAVDLHLEGLVVEFELLPEMTRTPEWGAEITAILRRTLDRFAQSDGLKSALRVTPNDIREFERPPHMRSGPLWDDMVRCFELCAQAGADLLSIESTGGKEIHDDAILYADLPMVAFALGVLGARDMTFLWDMIVRVAKQNGAVPAGDTACGFANTAMVLAETRHIPRVWAALIRVMSVARSLVAYERGAVGPSKDCAYEGPYIKAITGYPISLEGAEAAVAHASPVGNITKAAADLWSNESVQNVRLLGGAAPTISLEQLAYAARLMNTASAAGSQTALMLRNLFVDSDTHYDPQAYVLRPDVVVDLAGEMIAEATPYRRVRRAALTTLERLRKAHADGHFQLSPLEVAWLDRLSAQAERLPEAEEVFVEQMTELLDPQKVRLDQYELTMPVA